eukprot:15333977-Ditylum_brightwellii.AAC.1
MQQKITTAIAISVIASVNTTIDANLKAHLGASDGEPAQGTSSLQNIALNFGSLEHSSVADAAGK